jgi:ABC-type polysaccharide/polyol phosphate transport system ATPase subunit
MAEIEIHGVSKFFTVSHEKSDTLMEQVISSLSFNKRQSVEIFQALKGISLDVNKGECLGVIGRNGSGKSTLLKIIAGIIMPSSGSVRVRGRMLPFIELGAGFSPELTGKENIFLYGTLLGLLKKRITEEYEQTVEFAELGRFIDTKFKNYSSGMQARLSFSTALMIDPDVILIDEVLSVGDNSFQQRCINRIIDFKHENKTIIFVSHNLEQIKHICDRVILLDKGEILMQGKAEDVIEFYKCKIFEEDRLDIQQIIRNNEDKIKILRREKSSLHKGSKRDNAKIIAQKITGLKQCNMMYYKELTTRIDSQILEYETFIKKKSLEKHSPENRRLINQINSFRNVLIRERESSGGSGLFPEEEQNLTWQDALAGISPEEPVSMRIAKIKKAEMSIPSLGKKELKKVKEILNKELKRDNDLDYRLRLTKAIKKVILEELKNEK